MLLVVALGFTLCVLTYENPLQICISLIPAMIQRLLLQSSVLLPFPCGAVGAHITPVSVIDPRGHGYSYCFTIPSDALSQDSFAPTHLL